MYIPKKKIKELFLKYKINNNVVSIEDFIKYIKVELEHGKKFSKYGANITNNDIEKTFKIVLAHLVEHYLYYYKLEEMEEKLKKESNKKIFI